jgi:integrase
MPAERQPREKFLPNPKLKLREQLGEVMRFKHFSHRTEAAYWHWIKDFILFCREYPHLTSALSEAQTLTRPAAPLSHPMREGQGAEREKRWPHPRELGAAEVQAYLSHLAVERNVAEATQRQALNAIVFLYRDVLGREPGDIGRFEKPQRPAKLPTVLTKEEVRRVLAGWDWTINCLADCCMGRGCG